MVGGGNQEMIQINSGAAANRGETPAPPLFPLVANTNRLQGDGYFVLKQQRGRVYSLKTVIKSEWREISGREQLRGGEQLGLGPELTRRRGRRAAILASWLDRDPEETAGLVPPRSEK